MSPRTGHSPGRPPRSILPWLATPALVVYVGFAVVPLVGVFALSFTTWDGIGTIHGSGLDSWRAVLADPGLPHALWVTFLVMAVSWAVQTPLSILLGTFLAGRQRYRAVLGVVYFVPLMLSSAAIAIAYKALLDPNFGLGAGLKLPLLVQDWLGRPGLAFGVVVFVVSWQFVPFHTLIYQGGVQQIPTSLYEAAQLDGAGRVLLISASQGAYMSTLGCRYMSSVVMSSVVIEGT
ncbi:sugar ABC transporter permease, partial [Streptomyces sp. NPDC044948]|uniref:carbohydrate ABC transporter permease n=1 Tax=Streptomyces sp. NPDC044948 TaxID=3157092 RepID=UPI0033FCBE48